MKNFKFLEKVVGELVRVIIFGDIEEIQKVFNKYKKLRFDLSIIIIFDGITVFYFIVRWYRQTILEMILELGIEINVYDNDGVIFLQIVFFYNNLDIVKCFIEYGVDVNEFSFIKIGVKIIYKMVIIGRLNVVNIFIECGVFINLVDKMGCIFLYFVMIRNDFSMVKFLLEKGVEIDVCDYNGINFFYLFIIY